MQDLTQRMMLATWLVEFYLSKCNELDDLVASESVSHDVDDLQTERTILEDDLRHFFDTYKVGDIYLWLRARAYFFEEQFGPTDCVRAHPRAWANGYVFVFCQCHR